MRTVKRSSQAVAGSRPRSQQCQRLAGQHHQRALNGRHWLLSIAGLKYRRLPTKQRSRISAAVEANKCFSVRVQAIQQVWQAVHGSQRMRSQHATQAGKAGHKQVVAKIHHPGVGNCVRPLQCLQFSAKQLSNCAKTFGSLLNVDSFVLFASGRIVHRSRRKCSKPSARAVRCVASTGQCVQKSMRKSESQLASCFSWSVRSAPCCKAEAK